MSAGQKIRIQDLRDPILTEGQRAALAFAERNPVELSVDAVLTAANERTALDDFGPQDFRERLALWLSETDENPDRTHLGRLSLYNDCVRYASNRLRIRALLAEHPEILDVELPRPIIVVGLPRSGTTHLVNLIAADQRLRSMPLWESQEPVPDPREQPGPDGVDPRFARSAAAWDGFRAMSPLIAAMHPMNPEHIHEELELMCPDFTSYNLEWITRSPKWRDHLLSHDQTQHYAYMKTVLQILQWYRPRERWVLKCPQHLEQLGPLMTTFPDATIVVTHRDPVSVIQSAATMLTYGARMTYRTPEPEWYLEYWSDRMRRLLEVSVRDRHLLPSERTIDVLFHEFMADDVATVERIYEVAGLPMQDEARSQLIAYNESHPRGKDGQVVYDLRKDFGAEPSAVRAAFDFYLERFDIRIEVK
ncbi:MAG: sulfotransferase [Deltaproteobacteria bacterium]|nr:sulfotransferase [Deltaproteobacteria bacterium]